METNEIVQAYNNLNGLSYVDIVNDATNDAVRDAAALPHVYNDDSQAVTISIYSQPSATEANFIGSTIIGVHDPVGMQWLPLYRQEQCTGQLLVMWHRCLPPHTPSEPAILEKRFFMSAVEKERVKQSQQGRALIEEVCSAIQSGDQKSLELSCDTVRLLECFKDETMRALFVRRLLTNADTNNASSSPSIPSLLSPPSRPLTAPSLLFLVDVLNAVLRQASNKHDYALCQALLHVAGMYYTEIPNQTTLVQHVKNLKSSDEKSFGNTQGNPDVKAEPVKKTQNFRHESAFSQLKTQAIFQNIPYWEHSFVEAYNRARNNPFLIYHTIDDNSGELTSQNSSKTKDRKDAIPSRPGRGFSVVTDEKGMQKLTAPADKTNSISSDPRLQECAYYRHYCRIRELAVQRENILLTTNPHENPDNNDLPTTTASLATVPVTEDATNEAFLSQHPRPTATQALRVRLHRHVLQMRSFSPFPSSILSSDASTTSSALVPSSSLSMQDAVAERIIRSLICSVLITGFDVNAILQFMSTLSQTCHIPTAITQSIVPFWQRQLALIYRYLPDLAEANIIARRGCWLQCLSPCGVPYFYDDVHNVVMYKEPEGWSNNQRLMAVLRRGGSIIDEEDGRKRAPERVSAINTGQDEKFKEKIEGNVNSDGKDESGDEKTVDKVAAINLDSLPEVAPPSALTFTVPAIEAPGTVPSDVNPLMITSSPLPQQPQDSSQSTAPSAAVEEEKINEPHEPNEPVFHFPSPTAPTPPPTYTTNTIPSHTSTASSSATIPYSSPALTSTSPPITSSSPALTSHSPAPSSPTHAAVPPPLVQRMYSVRPDEYLLDDDFDEFEAGDESQIDEESEEEEEDGSLMEMGANIMNNVLNLGDRFDTIDMASQIEQNATASATVERTSAGITSPLDPASQSHSTPPTLSVADAPLPSLALSDTTPDDSPVHLTASLSPAAAPASPDTRTTSADTRTTSISPVSGHIPPSTPRQATATSLSSLALPIQVTVDSSLSTPVKSRQRAVAVHCVEQAVYYDPLNVQRADEWKRIGDTSRNITALAAATPMKQRNDRILAENSSENNEDVSGNVFFPSSSVTKPACTLTTNTQTGAEGNNAGAITDVWSSQAMSLRARTRSVAAGLATTGPRNAFTPIHVANPGTAGTETDFPSTNSQISGLDPNNLTTNPFLPSTNTRVIVAPTLERGEMEISRMEDVFCLDLPRMLYVTEVCQRAINVAAQYHSNSNPTNANVIVNTSSGSTNAPIIVGPPSHGTSGTPSAASTPLAIAIDGVSVRLDSGTLTTASALDLLKALSGQWTQPICVGALMLTNYRLLFCPYGSSSTHKTNDMGHSAYSGNVQQSANEFLSGISTSSATATQVLHDTFCSIPLHSIHRVEVAAALDSKPKHTLAPPLGISGSLTGTRSMHASHLFSPGEQARQLSQNAGPGNNIDAKMTNFNTKPGQIPHSTSNHAGNNNSNAPIPKSLLTSVLPPVELTFNFINTEVSCHVRCKDQRQVTFSLFPSSTLPPPNKRWKTFTSLLRQAAYPDPSAASTLLSSPTHPLSSLTTAIKRVNPKALPQLLSFAYAHRNVVVGEDGWTRYSPEREYHRQGALQSGKWQLSFINQRYEFSPTYPAVLAVPVPPNTSPIKSTTSASAAPAQSKYPVSPTAQLVLQASQSASAAALFHECLTKSKQYRSKGRLPVLTYYSKHSGAAILRAAQPLAGIMRTRSTFDEQLCKWANVRYIFDARPKANANANALKGGGTETKTDEYYGATLIFCDIENIHVMRGSLKKVTSLCRQTCPSSLSQCYSQAATVHVEEWNKRVAKMIGSIPVVEDDTHNAQTTPANTSAADNAPANQAKPQNVSQVDLSYLSHDIQGTHAIAIDWHSQLHETEWLKHLQLTLHAATQIASCVHNGASVLCHCSDGWDRTAQLCMLAQLLLDPYYRTIQGFAVLIEKDFCSFGHKFADRCGHADKNYHSQERSPIFIQALDCVYQILLQHPQAFEFQANLLDYLVGHAYSCKYGTFLFNSERERDAAKVRQFTSSVWTVVAKKKEFLNPNYIPKQGLLSITVDPRHVHLWPFYYRWDLTQKRA